ncbi:MAG: hypothetical protein KDC90_01595 [Ignavibacteriae bacterium]|nr:hypothetical protein [Ignavibacteriota bacterium]
MDPLSIILGILGLIITVLIAMIPYFRKVYFVGPELTIELIPDGGMSMNCGLSGKNDTSKGYVDGNNAIYVFEVTWKVNLKITNNSNITAYYPKLKFLNQQLSFTKLDNLETNTPIQGNEQIVLKGKYVMYEEVNGKERTQPNGLPNNFEDLKILLEYKNPHKKEFYTIFSNSSELEKNNYTRKKPKEFI